MIEETLALSLLARGAATQKTDVALRRALRRQVLRAMRAADLKGVLVCISLSDDAELHELNRAYADEDHATDVLSFSQREQRDAGMPVPPIAGREPLGDIIISVEIAQKQAAAQGHALLDELLHLSVHGLCHLLGYDHASPEEERVMFGYEALLRAEARGTGKIRRIAAPEPIAA